MCVWATLIPPRNGLMQSRSSPLYLPALPSFFEAQQTVSCYFQWILFSRDQAWNKFLDLFSVFQISYLQTLHHLWIKSWTHIGSSAKNGPHLSSSQPSSKLSSRLSVYCIPHKGSQSIIPHPCSPLSSLGILFQEWKLSVVWRASAHHPINFDQWKWRSSP